MEKIAWERKTNYVLEVLCVAHNNQNAFYATSKHSRTLSQSSIHVTQCWSGGVRGNDCLNRNYYRKIAAEMRKQENPKAKQQNILKIVDYHSLAQFLVNLTYTHTILAIEIGVRTNSIIRLRLAKRIIFYSLYTLCTALSMNFKYDEINKY